MVKKIEDKNNHVTLLICECSSNEHQIIVRDDPEFDAVYFSIHLAKHRLFKRIWVAIKYVFGYECRYGAFEEFIMHPEQSFELRRIADVLDKKK